MALPSPWRIWMAHLRRWARRLLRLGQPDRRPEGRSGISQLGHREYVGGRWDEIGELQFRFLVQQGLLPTHRLLDVACGALRAGVHFIPYLDRGHYWGLEKEPDLIEAGLKRELKAEIRRDKDPTFLINDDFDVTPITRPVDYIWIHSLFTHLTPERIQHCLSQMAQCSNFRTRCYATFFETQLAQLNRPVSHDHESFFYTLGQMREFCESAGWSLKYLGAWGHPRGQMMIELQRRDTRSD